VKNAIGFIGQQTSLNECFANADPLFCNNIVRNAQGFVTAVNGLNLNTGSNLVEGLDVEFHGRRSLAGLGVPGALDLSVFWNHLFKQQQVPFPGAPVQKEVGQADCYDCGRLGSGFRNKIFATATYTVGGLTLNYRMNYFSPVVDDLTDPAPTRVPAFFYHNMQVRYDVGPSRKIGLYFGINNFTDKKPPIFPDTNIVTFPGTQTVADTYDTYGRMLYAGVEVNF
jgi:iron complex outermembrane receptor protein